MISPERIACAAWKKAVGKNIALRTRALKMVRTTLVVEVEDELWRKNLWSLRQQILRNLEKSLGPEIVTDVELRIMPPRLGPRREVESRLALEPPNGVSKDESADIRDPGLRRIYEAARRRETA